MNTIHPLASHAVETSSGIFQQGFQSFQEWGERAVRYLQAIPQTLAQHPHALIAVIATANALFLVVLNAAINRVEEKLSDDQPKSYKILLISEIFAGASIAGFNILVSKATKAQMNAQTIAAITAASLVLRFLFNYMRTTVDPKQEEGGMTPHKKSSKPDSEILEEELHEKQEELSPLGIRNAAMLKKTLASELTKSAQLNERIAELELQMLDLGGAVAAKNETVQKLQALEKEIEEERVRTSKEVDQLKLERKNAVSELEKEKDNSNSKSKKLEETVVELEEIQERTEILQKNTLAEYNAAKKAHEVALKDHIAEKETALEEKKQALIDKQEAECALETLKQKNKLIEREKELLGKRIDELEAMLVKKDPTYKSPGKSVPPPTPLDFIKKGFKDTAVDSPGSSLF